MKIKKFVVFLLVIVVSLMSMTSAAVAQTTRQRLAEAEARRAAGRNQVQGTQNLLQGLRSEIADLMAELQVYDQRLLDAHEALDDIELALLGTQLRIEYAEADLEVARDDRDLQYEVLRARLRAMHESGPVGLLEVLFQASSFSDFLMRMEVVREVARFDQDLLDRLEIAEARYMGNIETLNRELNLVEALLFQQQFALEELYEAYAEHERRMLELGEDEAQVELLLELQQAEQRALDEEFGRIQAQHRAEEAEAERLRRAAAQQARNAEIAAQTARLNNFNGDFMWPIPASARITSEFGPRRNPITRRQETHRGVDVGAPSGTRLYAAADGYVRLAGWHGGYGLTVIIDHGNGYSTLYAHNSRNLVSVGQFVSRGQHIANVGSTGQSTGPHLHFEIRRNGAATDPMAFFGM